MLCYNHSDIVPSDIVEVFKDYNAEVVLGKSIRIHGTNSNTITHTPEPFDLTFRIGDIAVYDSYNMQYLGKILRISPKTITIDGSDTGSGNKRLSMFQFCWRNYDFNLAKIRERNHAISLTI